MPLMILSAVLGGYGLLRYGGAWIMERVRARHFLLRMPSAWLLLPRLRHDWPRDARLLALIAWMLTTAIGMASVCFIFWKQADQLAVQQNPWTVQVVGVTGEGIVHAVERVLADEGLTVQQKMSMPMLVAKVGDLDYILVSTRDFNRWLRLRGHQPFQVQSVETVYVFPYEGTRSTTGMESKVSVKVGTDTWGLDVVQVSDIRLLNEHPLTGRLLVMAEADFQQAWERFRKERRWIYGWEASSWRESAGAVDRLESRWRRESVLANTPVKGRELLRRAFAPLMFTSLFLSGLFFLSTATLLTFRLRQGVMQEPKRWHLLGEWGVTAKERWRIARWEVRLLFGLPWLLTLGYLLLINRFLNLLVPSETIGIVLLIFLTLTALWWLIYRYLWGKFVWWLDEKLEEGRETVD